MHGKPTLIPDWNHKPSRIKQEIQEKIQKSGNAQRSIMKIIFLSLIDD